MTKKIVISFIAIATLFITGSFILNSENTNKESMVKIETNYGDMVVKLYDETPKHKANMLKLVQENFYDSLLFHRVIPGFMIQGGDPDSKGAKPGKMLGMGGPGYTVPAEFNSKYIHKKGALSAARLGDGQNPEKASSGSQFYIVQGNVYTDQQLSQIEEQRIQGKKMGIIRDYLSKPENEAERDSVIKYQRTDQQAFLKAISEIEAKLAVEIKALEKYRYTPEQREIYKTIGGTPNLDFEYTVFGEVVSGTEVIDKIAIVPTDRADRPKNDVVMKMTIVK